MRLTVVVINHSETVGVGVPEELAGDDVRVALHERQVLAVEAVLEPVQRLPAVMPLVDAGRNVTKYVHLMPTKVQSAKCYILSSYSSQNKVYLKGDEREFHWFKDRNKDASR